MTTRKDPVCWVHKGQTRFPPGVMRLEGSLRSGNTSTKGFCLPLEGVASVLCSLRQTRNGAVGWEGWSDEAGSAGVMFRRNLRPCRISEAGFVPS